MTVAVTGAAGRLGRQVVQLLAAGATLAPEAYVFARSPDGRAAISPDGVSHRFRDLSAEIGVVA